MKSRNGGYTILEALIFLAVSGLLFALVYPSFVSRDNSTKFSESVNDMANKINDVINDVSTGYYPSNEAVCNKIGGVGNPRVQLRVPNPADDNFTQGTREECIFIGKVVRFNNSTPTMDILTMVGLREIDTNGTSPKTIDQAKPVAVHPDTTPGNPPDLTETYTTKWEVPITKVVYIGPLPVNNTISSIGMTIKLGGSNLSSSTKNIDLYSINGSNMSENLSTTVQNRINNNSWNTKGDFLVCMDDPNSSKVAGIIIDSQNGTKARAVFDNLESEVGGPLCS